MNFLNKMVIKKLIDSELNFLSELDKRLHYTRKTSSMLGGMKISGINHGYYDNKRGEKNRHKRLTKKQLERIAGMVIEKADVIFQPIQGPFGFHPCFMLSKIEDTLPGITSETNPLLRFSINQLPRNYDIKSLVGLYSCKENLRKCEFVGVTFEKDIVAYEY